MNNLREEIVEKKMTVLEKNSLKAWELATAGLENQEGGVRLD